MFKYCAEIWKGYELLRYSVHTLGQIIEILDEENMTPNEARVYDLQTGKELEIEEWAVKAIICNKTNSRPDPGRGIYWRGV